MTEVLGFKDSKLKGILGYRAAESLNLGLPEDSRCWTSVLHPEELLRLQGLGWAWKKTGLGDYGSPEA